jgi:hypothetical protein
VETNRTRQENLRRQVAESVEQMEARGEKITVTGVCREIGGAAGSSRRQRVAEHLDALRRGMTPPVPPTLAISTYIASVGGSGPSSLTDCYDKGLREGDAAALECTPSTDVGNRLRLFFHQDADPPLDLLDPVYAAEERIAIQEEAFDVVRTGPGIEVGRLSWLDFGGLWDRRRGAGHGQWFLGEYAQLLRGQAKDHADEQVREWLRTTAAEIDVAMALLQGRVAG